MNRLFDIDTTNSEEVKMLLLCLIVECPAGGNPDNCPLYEVRKTPLQDRIKWVNNQGYPEHLEIYLYHKECLTLLEK